MQYNLHSAVSICRYPKAIAFLTLSTSERLTCLTAVPSFAQLVLVPYAICSETVRFLGSAFPLLSPSSPQISATGFKPSARFIKRSHFRLIVEDVEGKDDHTYVPAAVYIQ